MKTFYVVEFPDEMADGTTPMSIISSTWVSEHEDQVYCVWPNMASDLQRHQMVVKHKLPSKNTSLNRVKIIYKSSNKIIFNYLRIDYKTLLFHRYLRKGLQQNEGAGGKILCFAK